MIYIKKNAIKKWCHLACLRVSGLLKWGNSTGYALKIRIIFIRDAKFYIKSKNPFIDISSIAWFKLFLIAWLWEYCTLSDSSVVSLKSSPWPNIPSWELFSKQKLCYTIKLFMFFIRPFWANTFKKNGKSPCWFKRKGKFISLSSLVWGKSLTFCKCTREWRENYAQ